MLATLSAALDRFKARRRAALILDEVDKSPQRRRQMAAAGIVEERSREALPPRLQHGLQSAAVEMRGQPFFKETRCGQAQTVQRGARQAGCNRRNDRSMSTP